MQLADTHVENLSNGSKFDKKKLAEYQDHIDFCNVHLELELPQMQGGGKKNTPGGRQTQSEKLQKLVSNISWVFIMC